MGADQGASPLTARLELAAERHCERLAIVHGDTRLTWAEVAQESRRLAKAMLASGISRGDHIGLWLSNQPKWLLLWLAAVRIGAAVVPINTRYKPAEASYILAKSNAVALVIEREFIGVDYVKSFQAMCPDWDGKRSSELPDLRQVVLIGDDEPGMTSFDAFTKGADEIEDADLSAVTAKAQPDDTIIVVFTSGTTGHPKGVMHTHSAVRMMDSVADWMSISEEDRVLGHLPLFHVAGVFSSFLLAMVRGGAIVQMDQWDPTNALSLISTERVSVLSGIPTHFIDLLRHPNLDSYDLSSLRIGWIGGATVPKEVVQGAREKMGMDALLPVYGMTETTSTTTLGRPTDPPELLTAGKGVPIGGYEVVTVDPGTHKPVPAGTEGEIAVRGYTVMKGYYRDEEATRAMIDEDGWLYTGDLGVFDKDGYLSITGRLSDKFIVGGNNVHPADIEHVLLSHPEVKQAHVVARADDRLGEVAVAFIEPAAGTSPSSEAIVAFCRERLASFKIPRDVVFVDAWPITPTGKVQRFKLREMAKARKTE